MSREARPFSLPGARSSNSAAVIDSHLHVWDLQRADYPWLGPQLSPIDVSLGLADVQPDLRSAGVDGVVLVQAADNVEDTENMFAAADRAPEVVGIVAWAPLDDPELTTRRIAALRADPRFVGIRVLIHDMADKDWIVRPGPDAGLSVLAGERVPFDYVTADPSALRHVPTICERHPQLRLVIDHLAKPPVGGSAAQLRSWRELLTRAAESPLVYAKISGLYPAGGDLTAWSGDDLRPIVDAALDIFGPSRLMLGSDWPVSVLAGGYGRVWSELQRIAKELDPADRDALLGGTATTFYGLGGAGEESR
jgi:L-fuconolactonase